MEKIGDENNAIGMILYWMVQNSYNLRNQLDNIYKTKYSEPLSSLISGVVLGTNNDFDENFYESLVSTGTINVVATSGFNITLIAKLAIVVALVILSRMKDVLIAIVVIIFYTMIAGASPAVVRAAIIGILAFGAKALGREYAARWGLLIL